MKKRIPSLLATMIASALYSQQGLAADLATQCMLGVPSFDRPLVEGRPGDLPVTIITLGVRVKGDKRAKLTSFPKKGGEKHETIFFSDHNRKSV